jgi:hypothetical protein
LINTARKKQQEMVKLSIAVMAAVLLGGLVDVGALVVRTKSPTTGPTTKAAPTTKAPTTKAPTTKAPTTKAPTTGAHHEGAHHGGTYHEGADHEGAYHEGAHYEAHHGGGTTNGFCELPCRHVKECERAAAEPAVIRQHR